MEFKVGKLYVVESKEEVKEFVGVYNERRGCIIAITKVHQSGKRCSYEFVSEKRWRTFYDNEFDIESTFGKFLSEYVTHLK